jgi:hypothetical protein
MPAHGLAMVEPQLSSKEWHRQELSKEGKPLKSELIPTPITTPPPEGHVYPQASRYSLVEDDSYCRGYFYMSPFSTSSKDDLKKHMLHLSTPPEVIPKFEKGSFHVKPLAGMIQLPLGVPFVQFLDGKREHAVTVCCAHTPKSMMQYRGGERVEALSDRLWAESWGTVAHDGEPETCAIYELEGLKRNDRSPDPKTLPPGSKDGSYSLAGTVLQGEGQGTVLPAMQTCTPKAAAKIASILQILHDLYREILPCCISRFEWEMMEFNCIDNNVFTFGGLTPGATGCQLNVSSDGLQLQRSIGKKSGHFHPDIGDDPAYYTFLVLLLKLPPGSDCGPFLLGRQGLYLRENDTPMVFLVFKGNDLHCGMAPSGNPDTKDEWLSAETVSSFYKCSAPEHRLVYVCYHSYQSTSRTTSMSISPQLGFLNQGSLPKHKRMQHNFVNDGAVMLGDSRARASRLAQEGFFGLSNFLEHAGLRMGLDIDALLQHTCYKDETGQTKYLGPPPLNIHTNFEKILLKR